MKIIRFNTLDSTNKYIKRNINKLGHMNVVIAYEQTAGVGRVSHIWETEKNKNLTFSILIKEKVVKEITLFVGYLMHKFLLNYKIESLIKWPNDLIVNDKKICGILVEGIWEEENSSFIIGIGLNVNQIEFNELSATSMKKITNIDYNNDQLLEKFLCLFEEEYNKLNNNFTEVIDYINDYSYLNDQFVSFNYLNKEQIGLVNKINYDGSIAILLDGKNVDITSGEVNKIRIKNG